MQQLGEAPLFTPGVRIFDYVLGESAEVTRISGGNAELGSGRRRLLRLGLSARPLGGTDLTLHSDYVRTRDRRLAAAFPAFSTELEAAFPDRFVRDGAGRLVGIDERPVDFARAARDELRSGMALKFRLGAGGQGDASLFHLWHLRDRARVAATGPRLDFLGGSLLPEGRPRSRHGVEFQAGVYRRGLGARLSGDVQGGATVASGGGALRFERRATLDVRLFVDLGERLGSAAGQGWARDMRLSLAITNLFDARPRVRDGAGRTPFAYQPAYLDPRGRSVAFTLRKLIS